MKANTNPFFLHSWTFHRYIYIYSFILCPHSNHSYKRFREVKCWFTFWFLRHALKWLFRITLDIYTFSGFFLVVVVVAVVLWGDEAPKMFQN